MYGILALCKPYADPGVILERRCQIGVSSLRAGLLAQSAWGSFFFIILGTFLVDQTHTKQFELTVTM